MDSASVELDESLLRSWIGRTERAADLVAAVPFAGMAATLDYPAELPADGTLLPPLWHWLCFLPRARQSEIGEDGHPRRGGFLPPVPLPRRMWAGSRLAFHEPLRVGDRLQRDSQIADVSIKRGKTGTLVFVQVRHELRRQGSDALALTEFQDIVYRDAPAPGAAPPPASPAPAESAWQRRIEPDPVLLFRYSALTFNGHRIHYDRPYATGVEGYPGLVVHGPLMATLLADLFGRHISAPMTSFQFRALRPVFDLRPFEVHGAPEPDGRSARLWVRDPDGLLAMEARAGF
ncbi:MAG: MaoC family dehydratase N-terminal domain-containing protein [Burkholderiaceae bacterium]